MWVSPGGKYGTVGCDMGNVWASMVMYGLVGLCIGQWGDLWPNWVMYV